MFNTEHLQEKWQPVLEHKNLPKIDDAYRRAVTTIILENQEKAMKEDSNFLSEAAPTSNLAASMDGKYDPILISLVRRSMPNLIAYDIAGVQPMTGPTGLIFAMRANTVDNDDGTGPRATAEALYNEPDTAFSATKSDDNIPGTAGHDDTNPAALNDDDGGTTYTVGAGMSSATAEALGDAATNRIAEMSFSIDKTTVTAKSRALRAEYTMELAQDLKAIHGLDAETELSNILSAEILAEINREVVRSIYITAKEGAVTGSTATAGQFDMDVDSNGRWSVEKFKGLMFQLEREANAIGQETRRGKGNMVICSSDVASALQMAGMLDYAPALNNNLNVDDTGNTFAGVLNGRHKVYIDPYSSNAGGSNPENQFFVSGYKGASPYDAGIFYCPYVPLQMVRAVGEHTFQPKIGFKTRYGLAANPFAQGTTAGAGALNADSNVYYRRVMVKNLM